MEIRVEIDEATVKELIMTHLQDMMGDGFPVDSSAVVIEVKSKQNWKSEWEQAAFRAVYTKRT